MLYPKKIMKIKLNKKYQKGKKMIDTIVKIDIEDWLSELHTLLQEETVIFDTEQDIIDTLVLKYNLTSAKAGKILIAAKQAGYLPDDIWVEHKENLAQGGAYSARMMLQAALREKELPNGKTVQYRQVIGTVNVKNSHEVDVTHSNDAFESTQEIQDSSHKTNATHIINALPPAPYVLTDTDAGIKRSKDYLLNKVVGHIRERFKELAGKEDLSIIADELKRKIDSMVIEFS